MSAKASLLSQKKLIIDENERLEGLYHKMRTAGLVLSSDPYNVPETLFDIARVLKDFDERIVALESKMWRIGEEGNP